MTGGMIKDAADEAGVDLGKVLGGAKSAELPFDEKLRRLHQMHVDGILSDEEYEREKQQILDEQ